MTGFFLRVPAPMGSRGRTLVAPAYLFACLLLGGSAQGIWQETVLQLIGILLIAWAALDRIDGGVSPKARQLLILALAAIVVILLQLVPLPMGIWSHIGPRSRVAEGFSLLGLAVPAQPLSLTPAGTLHAMLRLIPPLALFCAMVRLKAYRRKWLAVALAAGTIFGITLGALQVASSSPDSPWYLYAETSFGKAVGFFANADHMATLLLVTIPFLLAMIAAARSTSVQRFSAVIAAAVGMAVVIVVGIMLNGSLAGYGLALPVLAASSLLLIPAHSRLRLWIIAGTALLAIGALAAIETSSIGAGRLGVHASSSVQSRGEIYSTTARAVGEFMPFGSGLGSFASVYRLYERPEQVTTTFVVHAHNDYLELALELGLAGVVLMLLVLSWWAFAVWRVWRTAEGGPYARAAAISSAAILVHSLVDFPLRTAAISACFAMCLALLADGRSAPPAEKRELRRRRHREFR